jgi:Leucine-rich repeat (LRR) protein
MIPNIKSLLLNYCKNLVEVHDSVGCLDKLEVLSLDYCKKLRILPSYLMMESLRNFSILGCSSLKKFPNISREMKSLKALYLTETAICELPVSFENLTGLELLRFRNNLGGVHLPSSIYKLQHIEHLAIDGNVIFLKDVETDRGSQCKFNEGFSNVFPNLKELCLYDFKIHSEIDFILTICWPHTLEQLYIYNSNVVTLPESISRFERLYYLGITYCNEFQDIPRLPRSIRYVDLSSCDSLDSSASTKLFHQVSLSLSLLKLFRNNFC